MDLLAFGTILIVFISIGLAYFSVKEDMKKTRHEEVKKKLAKGRVIFYAPTRH